MEPVEAEVKALDRDIDLITLVRDMAAYLVRLEAKVNDMEKRLARLEQSPK